ncbi:hypothetical protein SBADM41S_00778 [Streptomyces badius]
MSAKIPISHHWVDEVTMGCFASRMITPSGWSWRCEPTPGESTRTSTPDSRRCPACLIPDSISSFGESIAPQETITSRRARTVPLCTVSGSRYSTPVHRSPSNSSRFAWSPVRTSRLGRFPSTGCRYDTEAEERVPSSRALIWNQCAPRITVEPVLNGTVGMPAVAHASSRAVPHGSRGGTVRMVTGPERPWWSPGAPLVSRRR